MQITQFMSEDLIFLDCPGETREDVITFIVKSMVQSSNSVKNGDLFLCEVLEREQLGGTGIGDEFAIPHARTERVDDIVIAFARTENPIDFEAIDGKKVRAVFLLAVPVKELKSYLTTLAVISRMIKDDSVRSALLHNRNKRDIIKLLSEFEK